MIDCQVLELSECYNPEVSDYYQGRITQVAANGDITADLIGIKQLICFFVSLIN